MRTAAKRKRQRETEPPVIATITAGEPEDAEPAAVADQPEEPKANGAPKPNGAAKAKGAKKPSLWDYLDREERNSDGCRTKVYRLAPVIHKSGIPHYVTQRNGRFSEQDLLEECGTGRYDLWVKDSSDTLVLRDQVSTYNLNFPPKVNPLELVVGDPQNEIYLKAWAPQSKSDKTNKDSATAGDLNQILSTVLEKSGSFDPKLAALWQQTAQQRDELSKLIAERNAPPDLVEQLRKLKEILPAPPAPTPTQQLDAVGLLKVVKELQPERKDPIEVLAAAKELFAPTGEPERGGDQIEQLDKILAFSQRLAGLRVGGGGGGRNGWEIGLDYGKEIGIPILQAIQNFMAMQRGSTAPPLVAPGALAAPPPQAFDPYQRPDLAKAFARAQNAPPPPAPPPPGASQPGPAQPAATGQPAANAMAEIAGLVATALNCLNRGISGHECADSIITLNGELAYESLVSQIKTVGVPAAVELAKAIPEIGAQAAMFQEPLARFINEFIEGPPWDEEEQDQEESKGRKSAVA